jgi:hypothetical protein
MANMHQLARQTFPKIIWSAWFQGEDNAPEVPRALFSRWRRANPQYEVRVLDEKVTRDVLADFPLRVEDIPFAARSDILRSKVLAEYGGIWTDASTLCVHPLDRWLEKFEDAELFAFESPGPDRLLSSWFLACAPNSLLMQRWWQEVQDYWQKPRVVDLNVYSPHVIPADPVWEVSPNGGASGDSFPYFWFHYLFERIITTVPACRQIWNSAPKLPAAPAHSLQELFRDSPSIGVIKSKETACESPIQKLDWRHSESTATLEQLIYMLNNKRSE